MRKYIATMSAALALCVGALPVIAENAAPVAENFEFETYREISFGAQLAAVDPEGDTVSFEITTPPKKGKLDLDEDGHFVYSPAEGKKGRDYFGYRAIDAEGNRSQEGTVVIKIAKKSPVCYVDMDGSASHCSAVKLAECGAFVGKRLGGDYYFEPESSLTRGEFLALCMSVTGADTLGGVVSTGFADDEQIPAWLKSCVASAVSDGVIKGRRGADGVYFDAGSTVTRAEAGVMLDRLLRLTDVGWLSAGEGVPAWAAQSAANLGACSIPSAMDGAPLTRAEAADMLAAAMSVIEKR